MLPAEKLERVSPRGRTFKDELHAFLLQKFNGYTISHGDIHGSWRDDSGQVMCGKYLEYRVACSNEEAIPEFEKFLSELARELEEQCIFWEHGGCAYLIYP